MKKFEIYVNGNLEGYTIGDSAHSVEMRLRRLGYKTSQVSICEVGIRLI